MIFADSNAITTFNNALCSTESTCATGSDFGLDFVQFFGPPEIYTNVNPCCGIIDHANYYSLDGGQCLPCELVIRNSN